jgi:hypothetical protein
MPDLWDTNSDSVFSTPGEQPGKAPSSHDNDHTEEVLLRDHRAACGHRVVLIALVIALAAILLLIVAVLFAPD